MFEGYAKKLYKYLLLYKSNIAKCIIMTLLINGISVLILYQFKIIVDQYVPSGDMGSIYKVALLLLVMVFIKFIFQQIFLESLNKFTVGTQYSIRLDIYNHIQKTKYEFFNKKKFSEVNTNTIQDLESLGNTISQRLVNFYSQIIYFIVTFFILFFINIYLSLFVSIFISLFSILIVKFKTAMEKSVGEYAATRASLNEVICDVIDGIKIINTYGIEDRFLSKLESSNIENNNKWLRTNIYAPAIQSSIEIAILITYLLTFIVGGMLVSNNTLSIGGLLLFLSYLPQIWGKYGAVVDIYSGLLNTRVYAKRVLEPLINETYEENENQEQNIGCNLENPTLIIKDITFSYDNSKDIFKGFSEGFYSPGIYCIVGESGCGKTTLFQLLLRFYKVNRGAIFINNTDINNYPLHQLRGIIGIVHQDTYIINDTVIGNIKFGDTDITDEKIIDLSRRLGFDKYLSSLENGYYTIISHESKNISSGQKRLISLLRVLVREPKILLFDEITTNINSFTEGLIHSFLQKISKEKICLLITHKANEVLLADKVVNL